MPEASIILDFSLSLKIHVFYFCGKLVIGETLELKVKYRSNDWIKLKNTSFVHLWCQNRSLKLHLFVLRNTTPDFFQVEIETLFSLILKIIKLLILYLSNPSHLILKVWVCWFVVFLHSCCFMFSTGSRLLMGTPESYVLMKTKRSVMKICISLEFVIFIVKTCAFGIAFVCSW